jgi:hypothetical protein
MAIALPWVIPAAQAALAAAASVGSAILIGLGLKKAVDAIEEEFSKDPPGCVQSCPQAVPTPMPNATLAVPWVDNPEAAREHDAYKDIALTPRPPNLDECEGLKWELKREQTVVAAMEAWDAKWLPGQPGRHVEAIRQRKQAIENLKKKIQKACKE